MTSTPPSTLSTEPTRREDNALLRGLACFGQDVALPGAWHVAFVRSPHAHARLLGLDAQAAQGMAGVVTVLTAAELGKHHMPPPTRCCPCCTKKSSRCWPATP